jgi:hypothetical protein
MAELFRHRFLHALREAKLSSPAKLADLLSWQHRGWRVPRQSVRGASRPVKFLLSNPHPLGRAELR